MIVSVPGEAPGLHCPLFVTEPLIVPLPERPPPAMLNGLPEIVPPLSSVVPAVCVKLTKFTTTCFTSSD